MNRSTTPNGFFLITIIISIFILFISCTTPASIKDETSASKKQQPVPIQSKTFESPDWKFAFDEAPVLVYFAPPKYPEAAKKSGREGEVKIKLTVDKEGRVVNVELFESNATEAMDQAALEAAKKCRFKPAKKKGVPVQAHVMVPFHFRLNKK
jgi:TonB family protein